LIIDFLEITAKFNNDWLQFFFDLIEIGSSAVIELEVNIKLDLDLIMDIFEQFFEGFVEIPLFFQIVFLSIEF